MTKRSLCSLCLCGRFPYVEANAIAHHERATDEQVEEWEVEAKVKNLLKDYFRPEFLNRIDEIILFHALRKEQITRIVDVQLQHLQKRLATRGLKLALDDAAKKLLADEGYDPQFGARPLKRVIQQRIENPLASRILAGNFAEGDTIRITVDPAKHDFTFTRESGAPTKEPAMAGR